MIAPPLSKHHPLVSHHFFQHFDYLRSETIYLGFNRIFVSFPPSHSSINFQQWVSARETQNVWPMQLHLWAWYAWCLSTNLHAELAGCTAVQLHWRIFIHAPCEASMTDFSHSIHRWQGSFPSVLGGVWTRVALYWAPPWQSPATESMACFWALMQYICKKEKGP